MKFVFLRPGQYHLPKLADSTLHNLADKVLAPLIEEKKEKEKKKKKENLSPVPDVTTGGRCTPGI